jgi:hypothetical protein
MITNTTQSKHKQTHEEEDRHPVLLMQNNKLKKKTPTLQSRERTLNAANNWKSNKQNFAKQPFTSYKREREREKKR